VKYYRKFANVFMGITRYSCPILMKLEVSRQIFEEYSISDFMKIRPMEA